MIVVYHLTLKVNNTSPTIDLPVSIFVYLMFPRAHSNFYGGWLQYVSYNTSYGDLVNIIKENRS